MPVVFSPRRLSTAALLVVGLFTVAYFFLAHEGIYDYDDYTYARYAHQLATGTFERALPVGSEDYTPLHERPLVFGPVAALYQLGGVTILLTTLWPLLCTLGTSLLCYLLYHRQQPLVAAATVVLLGLHYFNLNLSIYLYPDNILLFFALASATALLRGRRGAQANPAAGGAAFAGLTFAALLSKETIVYYFPFYLLVLGRDAWQRRHGRFWLAAGSMGLGLLICYLLYYQLTTHDPLYRLHVIEFATELGKEHSYALGRADLLARVTYQPLALFVGTGLAGVLLLAALALAQWRHLPAEGRYWLALAGTALAFYWIGSTSLTYYNPNSLLPRMTTPLLPPLCLAAGFGLRHFLLTGRGGWWLAVGLLGCAGWLHNALSVVYGGLGLTFAGAALLAAPTAAAWRRPGTAAFAGGVLVAVAACTAIRPAYFMQKPSASGYAAQHRLLQRHLRGPAGGVVFADNFLLRNYDFWYGFHVPTGLRFLPYAAYDTLRPTTSQPRWLLLNRRILANDELTPQVIPYSAAQVLRQFPHRRLVAREDGVELYAVK